MAAFGSGDQVSASIPTGGAAGWGTWNLPNFVGELFKLSPLETPILSMIGGLTGGRTTNSSLFTWQDTLHRSPALQTIPEGDDTTFSAQKRNERRNVVQIFQYGTEVSYSKQSDWDALGLPSGNAQGTAEGMTGATSILGTQPVRNEQDFQMQILIEQCALDVELTFLTETYAHPADGTARQTQGIIGAVAAATSTDWTGSSKPAGRDVINDLAQKLYDEGAPMRNMVLVVDSQGKVDIGEDYSSNSNWSLEPRSRSVFGVNVTDLETEFGMFPVVLDRHLPANTALILELDVMAPRFKTHPTKGNFFVEPIAKSGAYDREQLYGEIGLEYGPTGWHARAYNLNTA